MILYAVTLACTAAFAAGSTALLCILFLSNQPKNGTLLGIQARLDSPSNTVKCDTKGPSAIANATHVVETNEATVTKSRYNSRRSILPNAHQLDDGTNAASKDEPWPIGAVWLMVRTLLCNNDCCQRVRVRQ